MSNTPVGLKSTEPSCVAFASMTGPYAQIPATFARLYGWVASHGLAPAGMPSGVYLTDPREGEERARWELRAPLAGSPVDELEPSGFGVKRIGPCLVAWTIHRGPYEQLAGAYAAIAEWAAANGYRVAGPPEELYMSEPGTPPEETLTEVRMPVERG